MGDVSIINELINYLNSPQLGSTENWKSVFVVQVTVLSPLSSYPTLQLRDRTVPVETGNFLSAFMLFQVVFRPVQSEKEKYYRSK